VDDERHGVRADFHRRLGDMDVNSHMRNTIRDLPHSEDFADMPSPPLRQDQWG
jgi:hypothetical protein